MNNNDLFVSINFDYVNGWWLEPDKKDTPEEFWNRLLDYGKTKYEEKFHSKPNIGFVNPTTFDEKFWKDDTILVLKTLYVMPRIIYLGELSDAILQTVLDQAESSGTN